MGKLESQLVSAHGHFFSAGDELCEALHLILDIIQLADCSSSASTLRVKWLLSLRIQQLVCPEMCVCVSVYATFLHSASQNQCLLVSCVCPVPVFGDRLQLPHHMTFRSFPVEPSQPPMVVMGNFVCTELGSSNECALCCRKGKRGCGIVSLAADSPVRLLKRRTYQARLPTSIRSSLPVSAFTLPPSIYNDPWDAPGCNVSAFPALP